MSEDVGILLVEDHDIVREGLRGLIDAHPGYVVVGEASTGLQALELARSTSPQVAIVDINMPEMNGIETTRRLLQLYPDLKVVGLSVHTGGTLVEEMLDAGCTAYLPKKCAARELFVAIDAALQGSVYVSPEVSPVPAGVVVPDRGTVTRAQVASLTPREREVWQRFAEGMATKEVAAALKLAGATVHSHRQSIMRKLGCHSIVELTRLAIREGITSLDYP